MMLINSDIPFPFFSPDNPPFLFFQQDQLGTSDKQMIAPVHFILLWVHRFMNN